MIRDQWDLVGIEDIRAPGKIESSTPAGIAPPPYWESFTRKSPTPNWELSDGMSKHLTAFKAGPPRLDAAGSALTDATASAAANVAVIDEYAFTRECIAHSLQALSNDIEVFPFRNAHEARQSHRKFGLLLYYRHGDEMEMDESDAAFWQELATLAPTIILSSGSERDFVVKMFERGVRGYIPTESTTLELALEILRLIRAGGSFVPLDVLALGATDMISDARQLPTAKFTTREKSVITLLKLGTSNKIIAYELKMSESTVKVHIRNIMRKMKVKNRTEVVSRILGVTGEFGSGE
jgi:DNA-binding NarL/FixJ family response regulator